jgi:hypothetical protein
MRLQVLTIVMHGCMPARLSGSTAVVGDERWLPIYRFAVPRRSDYRAVLDSRRRSLAMLTNPREEFARNYQYVMSLIHPSNPRTSSGTTTTMPQEGHAREEALLRTMATTTYAIILWR